MNEATKSKQKKFTTTKIIVFLSYVVTFFILGLIGFVAIKMTSLIINAIDNGQDISAIVSVVTFLSTLITQLVAAHVSSELIRGYITKSYMKKSNTENLPYLPIKYWRGIIEMEQETGYQIHDKATRKKEILETSYVFTDPIKSNIKEVILEDVTTQAK